MNQKITVEKTKSKGRTALLSFQHMFAMLGATIVVPILANMSIPSTLIAVGVGTIIFYFVTKKKVPVFLGSSFAFLPALITVMGDKGAIGSTAWNEAMGGLVIAIWLTGLVYLLLALLVKKIGVVKFRQLFPPRVVGPVIIVIGMILAPKMFYNNIIGPTLGATGIPAWKSWTTAILTLLTIVGTSVFAKPKSIFKVAPILLGFIVGYVYAACIGLVDYSGTFSVNNIVIFQSLKENFSFWGYLHFDLNTILMIVPIALVVFMEHLGDISSSSVVCGKDFMVDPGIDKTLTGDGLALIAGACLGGPPVTTYGENTAVLAITKNYDPKNLFYAACIAVVFGVVSIFGTFISTIPAPVIGGASIVLFGMISASGLRSLIDAQVDMSKTKNMMIVCVILALGLGLGAMSLASDISGISELKIMVGDIEISALAIATLVGIVLNLILPEDRD